MSSSRRDSQGPSLEAGLADDEAQDAQGAALPDDGNGAAPDDEARQRGDDGEGGAEPNALDGGAEYDDDDERHAAHPEHGDGGDIAEYGGADDGRDGAADVADAPVDPIAAAIEALPATLLQYAEPIVLDEAADGTLEELGSTTADANGSSSTSKSATMKPGGAASLRHPCLAVFRQQVHVLSETPVVTTTDRMLHALLPPREYSVVTESAADGKPTHKRRLVQPVSDVQASRKQLSELKEVLDFKLRDAKARQTGICPVRRAIYTMLFDELLRQTTIDCPERGLLLLRMRDQLRMTYDAQCALYEASVQDTRRRIYEATKSRPELMGRVDQLQSERESLHKEVRRLEARHVALLRAAEEQQQADSKKHAEEITFLERTKQRLSQHIERVKDMHEEERRKMRGDVS